MVLILLYSRVAVENSVTRVKLRFSDCRLKV